MFHKLSQQIPRYMLLTVNLGAKEMFEILPEQRPSVVMVTSKVFMKYFMAHFRKVWVVVSVATKGGDSSQRAHAESNC